MNSTHLASGGPHVHILDNEPILILLHPALLGACSRTQGNSSRQWCTAGVQSLHSGVMLTEGAQLFSKGCTEGPDLLCNKMTPVHQNACST